MSKRKEIRDALAALAVDGGHVATAASYRREFEPHELPALAVYFDDGETEFTHNDSGYTEANVYLELFAETDGNIDDFLDAILTLIENDIHEDETLGGLIEGILRTGFSYDRDHEHASGSLAYSYTATYLDED